MFVGSSRRLTLSGAPERYFTLVGSFIGLAPAAIEFTMATFDKNLYEINPNDP
jgi:hypothetical protein